MRRIGVFALVAFGCAACQALLNFDERDTKTVFVVVGPDGASSADGGDGDGAGGVDVGSDGAATGPCAALSPSPLYCADFNGPYLEAYGPFPTNADYTLVPGGLDGTNRLSVGPIASPVVLPALGTGAEASRWRLTADVGCRISDPTSSSSARAFLGLVSTNGGIIPVLFCGPSARGLQMWAGFLNVNSGEYVPTLTVLNPLPQDGSLRHIELVFHQSGSDVVMEVQDGTAGGSLPGSGALSSMRLAVAISGAQTNLTAFIDNLVLRRE